MHQNHAAMIEVTPFGLRAEESAHLCAQPSLAFQASSLFGSEKEFSSDVMWVLDKMLPSSALAGGFSATLLLELHGISLPLHPSHPA